MSRRTPVRKRIEIVPPVLEAKGQAPTRSCPAPPLREPDLLPALPADVRATLVAVLADLATAELDRSVNSDPDPEK